MKNRQQFSPITKTVAAFFCVAFGFGLARATPDVQTGKAAALLGWNVAANNPQESYLTGDGRRFSVESSEIDAQKSEIVEIAVASLETTASNDAAELVDLAAQPAEFDDASTFENEADALAVASSTGRDDSTWCQNADRKKWSSLWKAETYLTPSTPNVELVDAVLPAWDDPHDVQTTVEPNDASVVAFDANASSVVDPKLTRWMAFADIGSEVAFFQETRTRAAENNDVRNESRQTSETQNDDGKIYPARVGVGCYVASGTFDAENGSTKK